MKKQTWGIVALVAGLALLIVSFVWTPAEVFWAEEDQRVFDVAAERAHQAVHRLERAEQGRSASEKEAALAELETANQQLTQEQQRFDSAEGRMLWLPRLLMFCGIAALVGGIALLAR